MTQGSNTFENKNRWPPPLCLNPHPILTDTFEAPWHSEGMFGGPHPDAWGPEGGLFTLFYTLLPRPGVLLALHLIQTEEAVIEAETLRVFIVLGSGGEGPGSTGTH